MCHFLILKCAGLRMVLCTVVITALIYVKVCYMTFFFLFLQVRAGVGSMRLLPMARNVPSLFRYDVTDIVIQF